MKNRKTTCFDCRMARITRYNKLNWKKYANMGNKTIQENKLKTICQIKEVNILGMSLMEWRYKSCIAHIAEFSDAATLYDIQSKEQGKGHATKLLLTAKDYYVKQNKKIGGSVALNQRMADLYKKVGIEEYKDI